MQGILDMIVLSKVEGKEELIIHALKNNFEADAYFVKVIGEYEDYVWTRRTITVSSVVWTLYIFKPF